MRELDRDADRDAVAELVRELFRELRVEVRSLFKAESNTEEWSSLFSTLRGCRGRFL